MSRIFSAKNLKVGRYIAENLGDYFWGQKTELSEIMNLFQT